MITALLSNDGAALGGERPIVLLPKNVRILDRLFYGELSAWCDSAHGFWDRAIANRSAPRSAIHTSLMTETAPIMGISAGILFTDLPNIYDSVDLVLLIKACSVLEYPRTPLLLLVQAFSGPRTDTCFSPVGGRVLTGKSLGQSVASSGPTRLSPPMPQALCLSVCG